MRAAGRQARLVGPMNPSLPQTRAALHLAQVVGVLAIFSLVPYTHERLGDYRYWDRIDWSPLLRAVTFTPPTREAAVLEMGPPAADDAELVGDELDQLAGVTLRDPMQRVGIAAAGAAPAPPASGAGDDGGGPPVVETPAAATRAEALQVADDALGDQTAWIEGDAAHLAGFYRALHDLAAGVRTHVRIAHYGDSHIANDGITHVTRQLLQRRFGNGGHGFTLVQGRTQWYGHKGVQRSASDGWRIVNFLNGNAKDGAYGYGGVGAEGGAGETFTLGTAGTNTASRATLYLRSLGRATVHVSIDDKPARSLDISSPSGTDLAETWSFPDGKHTLTWTVKSGRVRLFGAALEREGGLVYDSLGEVGARGTRWLNANEAHVQAMMVARAPDLLILNYGGNERLDNTSESRYLERMGRAIQRLRAGRAVSCLVVGPSDHGVRSRGQISSDLVILRINAWQRKLATAQGCGFWDAIAFMGGEGAMGRWVKSGLGWSDYSHFTHKGEQSLGVATYRALLHGLRSHVRTAAK
jgi:hypothetical protein